MNTHKFEHPLNEKTRIYLRVEHLLKQAHTSAPLNDAYQYQIFFRSLFDLLEIFEQIHLKSELAKDLEKQRQMYRLWLDVEGVDQAMLRQLLDDIDHAHRQLMSGSRIGQQLKEDCFLSSIRQRFSLPGGACCFDLPALHFWLGEESKKEQDSQRWLASLTGLSCALQLWLKLCRETGHYQPKVAQSGFFQSDASEANILRLAIPSHFGAYPMISGHKNRFAIKFINFDDGQASAQDIEFELAVCS